MYIYNNTKNNARGYDFFCNCIIISLVQTGKRGKNEKTAGCNNSINDVNGTKCLCHTYSGRYTKI